MIDGVRSDAPAGTLRGVPLSGRSTTTLYSALTKWQRCIRSREPEISSLLPPTLHTFYMKRFSFFFFFAVWLLIIDRCNGFRLLLLCAQNINASLPSLSLGAAQPGAIDVISFLEA